MQIGPNVLGGCVNEKEGRGREEEERSVGMFNSHDASM